jgi:hypothetical protein
MTGSCNVFGVDTEYSPEIAEATKRELELE